MNEKSSVFEETYANYLVQIGRLDFKEMAVRLGAEMVGDELIIPFFGKPMRVSASGISRPIGGRPNFSVCVILFKYLLLRPDHDPVGNDWVSFKDFKDSAPFAGALTMIRLEMTGLALRISRIRHRLPVPSSITPKFR
jgi:hypothetical protein